MVSKHEENNMNYLLWIPAAAGKLLLAALAAAVLLLGIGCVGVPVDAVGVAKNVPPPSSSSPNHRQSVDIDTVAMTFTQAIDRAHIASQQLHVEMETYLDQMRDAVSAHLTVISEDTLRKLLLAIEAVERRRDTGTADCDASAEVAAVDFAQLGAQLSHCAMLSDRAIQSVADAFFQALDAPQDISLSLLSLALDYVSRANPVNAPASMSQEILRSVTAMRMAHELKTVPALGERLAAVKAAVLSVPEQTSECVAPVLQAVRC